VIEVFQWIVTRLALELALTFGRLAGIGIFPKVPNTVKHPKSGQVAQGRAKSHVIFLMEWMHISAQNADKNLL